MMSRATVQQAGWNGFQIRVGTEYFSLLQIIQTSSEPSVEGVTEFSPRNKVAGHEVNYSQTLVLMLGVQLYPFSPYMPS